MLHFRVALRDLDRFRAKSFGVADDGWAAFVRSNRSGGKLHEFDIVSGPMLANPKAFARGARPASFGQQMSFHTQAAVDLLNGTMVGR